VSAEFDEWLTQIAAGRDPNFPLTGPSWDAWLAETFREWGALSPRELQDLAGMSQVRIMELELELARTLVPAIVADGRAVGMTIDVAFWIDDGGLALSASPEPGSRYYGTSNAGSFWPAASQADLLAWLADEVQEATMERDQIHCFVWPTCDRHQLGGHADVVDGVAVWTCNGNGGHVMAPIGELGGSQRRKRR
jgi:hypothetical protein